VSALDNGDPHPISQSYTNLSFYYKLELVSDVGVEVFTAGVVLQDAAGNGIAGGSASLNSSANTGTYTLANVPINYFGAAPVGATITFLIVGSGIAQGSYYVIDDVSLNFLSTGIGEMEDADVLSAPYPSPAIDAVNLPFTLASASEVSVAITDAQGRTVETRDLGVLGQGTYKEVLAVANWVPGVYTCTLTTRTARSTSTIVVGTERNLAGVARRRLDLFATARSLGNCRRLNAYSRPRLGYSRTLASAEQRGQHTDEVADVSLSEEGAGSISKEAGELNRGVPLPPSLLPDHQRLPRMPWIPDIHQLTLGSVRQASR
jgi:hypothetical protein